MCVQEGNSLETSGAELEMKPQRMNACCLWARWLWRWFGVRGWHRAKFWALSASWGRGRLCPVPLPGVLSQLFSEESLKGEVRCPRACISMPLSPQKQDLGYCSAEGG